MTKILLCTFLLFISLPASVSPFCMCQRWTLAQIADQMSAPVCVCMLLQNRTRKECRCYVSMLNTFRRFIHYDARMQNRNIENYYNRSILFDTKQQFTYPHIIVNNPFNCIKCANLVCAFLCMCVLNFGGKYEYWP